MSYCETVTKPGIYKMATLSAVIIVFLTSTLVMSQDDRRYSECIYNSYRAVCMGRYELMSRENRGLTAFPSVTRGVTCLKLGRNAIQRFPDDLTSLKEIVTLDLAVNRIRSLPNDLDKMSKLEILDLSENLLEMLSPSTKFPPSLRGLLVAKNRMRTIPTGVVVPGLFVLDLSQNQFTDIPEQFCVSNQLIRVDFTQNSLNSDVSHYIKTVNRCKNINNIPFCLFMESANIKCDCSSVGPILGGTPSFCMGTRLREVMQCTTGSEDVYKGKKLLDMNVTMVKDACSLTSNAASTVLDTEINLVTAIMISVFFCLT